MCLFEQRGRGDEQDMEEGEQAEEEEDEDSGSHKRTRHHDEEVMEALPLRKRPKIGTETAPVPLANDPMFKKDNYVLIMCEDDDDDTPFWCGRIVAAPWWKGDDPYTKVHYYGPLTKNGGYKGVLVPSRRAGPNGDEDYIEELHCGCVMTEFEPTQTRQGVKIPQRVYNAYAEKQVVRRADLQSDDEDSDED
jgi:hypothetical protein